MSDHDICSICLNVEPLNTATVLSPCNHVFHQKCIFNWKHYQDPGSRLSVQCPLCRGVGNLSPIVRKGTPLANLWYVAKGRLKDYDELIKKHPRVVLRAQIILKNHPVYPIEYEGILNVCPLCLDVVTEDSPEHKKYCQKKPPSDLSMI